MESPLDIIDIFRTEPSKRVALFSSYWLGLARWHFSAARCGGQRTTGIITVFDQAEDIHSPIITGFWNSHIGWIISEKYDRTRFELIQDFAKYKELQWLNRYHVVPGVALAVLLFIFGGWAALAWGFFLSTVLLYHATFSINSLVHVFGSRRYATPDQSRNNPWLSLLTMGENWHNNHHAYMSSANQGFFWWELDLSFYVLRVLGVLGVVHGLRLPPMKSLEAKRQKLGLDEFARDEDEDIRTRQA